MGTSDGQVLGMTKIVDAGAPEQRMERRHRIRRLSQR
jgi:hypothetical protein